MFMNLINAKYGSSDKYWAEFIFFIIHLILNCKMFFKSQVDNTFVPLYTQCAIRNMMKIKWLKIKVKARREFPILCDL